MIISKMDQINEDIQNTPLFAFLAQELKALTSLIADRDLDIRMLNRRLNAVEDHRRELEWRMESYEAFVTRILDRDRDIGTEVIQEIAGDNDYYSGDLYNFLLELETDEDEEEATILDDVVFDWDTWFPETVDV